MNFHPLSITTPHIVYACLGALCHGKLSPHSRFGMFSLFIREKRACWAFLFGVIIGPYGANLIDPPSNTITLEFTRVLPKAYMARHWKSLFFLLVPVMTWGWLLRRLIYALIPDMSFLSSLAVAACLTPLIRFWLRCGWWKVCDKHVPAHLRHLLAAESGCNDGAAYPFLFISLYLILDATPETAVRDWFLFLWLYQIVLSVAFGSLIGYSFRHLMKFCERNDLIDLRLSRFLTIGIMTMLGSDDLLAAFCCAASVFSSVIDLLFNVAAFVYVGAWMPFDSFTNATLRLSVWRLIVIAILVLLLRRLPIMIMLYKFIPDVKTIREAVFSGHFGPIGIGKLSCVHLHLAVELLPKPNNPPTNQTEFWHLRFSPSSPSWSLQRSHSWTIDSLLFSRPPCPFRIITDMVSFAPQLLIGDHKPKLVTRPEDIVINRDRVSEMEKGEAGTPAESSGTTSKRTSVGTVVPPAVTDARSTDIVEEDRVSPSGTLTGEEFTKENPPDGSGTELEWREGPHKVIERRRGPGEEVEIEVVRNAYNTQQERASSFFRGQKHACEAVGARLPPGASTCREYVQGEFKGISGAYNTIFGVQKNAFSAPCRPWRAQTKRKSGYQTGVTVTRVLVQLDAKQLVKPGPAPTVRTDQSQEAGSHRGRSVRSERPTTDHPVPRSIKHRRLESLKMDQTSRDVSPARSVRFADEGARSGTITPRSFSCTK
ncbi:Sodium/hydrogen exchanger family-domain-containing protein [Pisolithus marmoratus]|nr:Sodium/hydrogen exchanger family-domain-containing protein [Pisolithus marmoratus]